MMGMEYKDLLGKNEADSIIEILSSCVFHRVLDKCRLNTRCIVGLLAMVESPCPRLLHLGSLSQEKNFIAWVSCLVLVYQICE